MTDYSPDTWSETAYVALSVAGGTEHEYMTITETIDIKIGDKDIDVLNTLAGGRLVKFNPQDVTEITLEAYPVQISGGKGFMDLMHTTTDVTQPISITNDRTRQKVRCVILWTTDTTVTTATGATTGSNAGYRFTAKNGYLVSFQDSMTDGVKKSTIKLKFPAFDKDGAGNLISESSDGTATLPSISSYT